ncbi:MFS transporter [Hydrogenophaga sp. PAMC20947]|uniref:MFS transporter n=1 Tax=Hydrogenophaga sp. PAMC20947 TaxID=2565558 RepID=UPI001FFA8D4C|nr:MFS transporter [Hydrogenophaga sp. PAMC20947]
MKNLAPNPHHPYAVPNAVPALLAIFLAVFLSALDTAIANTALPAISADLRAGAAASVWVVNAYQLAVVAVLLPFAALGDFWGPRRVFLMGLVVFTVGSLGCALSTSLPALSLARVVQGVGAGGIMAVNLALVRLIFAPGQLGRGVGLNAFVVGLGFSLGPTVASLVLSVVSWPWLFGINVPLGILGWVLGRRAIPHSPAHSASHRFDPAMAVLAGLTFAGFTLAISLAGQRASLALVLSAVSVCLVCGVALLRRQSGHPAPMLPVDLLARPLFSLSVLTSICSFATQGLAFVSLPFYFETVLHRDPIQTGFLMSSWAVVVAGIAPFAGRWSDRYAPATMGGVGMAILSLGMVSLALMPADASVTGIVLRMAVCGLGFGLFQSPNLRAIMSSAPGERAGGASGMVALSRLTGQTGGAAMVALCLSLGGTSGAGWALSLGAATAALAAAFSASRLWAK